MAGEEGAERAGQQGRRRFGRGRLLAGGLGALVGGLTGRVGSARAASGEPLILGKENESDLSTGLRFIGQHPALRVDGTAGIQIITEARPLEVHAPGGAAVWGTSSGDPGAPPSFPTGVLGQGVPGVAGLALGASEVGVSLVQGFAPGALGAGNRFGFWGLGGPSLPVVSCAADFNAGGVGVSDRIGAVGVGGHVDVMLTLAPDFSAGMLGAGDTGIWGAVIPPGHQIGSPPPRRAAVLGTASPDATAVLAENPDGLALKAVGASEFVGDSQFLGEVGFATSGRGVIPPGQKSVVIPDANVHPDSRVLVNLNGNPGTNRSFLHYVELAEGSFRVVMRAAPTRETPFAYLVYATPT